MRYGHLVGGILFLMFLLFLVAMFATHSAPKIDVKTVPAKNNFVPTVTSSTSGFYTTPQGEPIKPF